MAVNYIPDGYHTVTSYLMVDDAARALDFYRDAFGAEELFRLPMGDKIGHAEIMIGDTHLMLADEFPDMGALGPNSRGGPTASFMIYVPDADAAYDRALKAGAKADRPLKDEFWGDRIGTVIDPFGHKWSLATHIEDVAPDEMQPADGRMEQVAVMTLRDPQCGSAVPLRRSPCRAFRPIPIQPRYMPEVLNGMAMLPSRSSAMAPPSPPSSGTRFRITASAAWREAGAAVGHARGDIVRDRVADEELAPARARHRATLVGPGAGADQRRIAHAAVALVGHAAGGSGGGEVALLIQRDRAHGAEVLAAQVVGIGIGVRCFGALARLFLFELRPARVRCRTSRWPRARSAAGCRRTASAPAPIIITCGECSITARASVTGLRMVSTPATAPARRVWPSMIEASSSCLPSAL